MKIIFRLLHRVTKALVIIMLCLSLLACILFPPFGAFLATLLGYAIAAMAPAACVVLLVILTVASFKLLKAKFLAATPRTQAQAVGVIGDHVVESINFAHGGLFGEDTHLNESMETAINSPIEKGYYTRMAADADGDMTCIDVNPATGLIMVDGTIDIGGTPCGSSREE